MSDEKPDRARGRDLTRTLTFRAVLVVALVSALVGGVFLFGGGFLSPDDRMDPNDGADPDGGSPSVIASSPKAGPPEDQALRVVDVRPMPRWSAEGSWLHPSPIGGAALDRLQSDLRRAGSVLTEEADAVMRAAGAIPATVSTMELELEGNHERPVRITRVQAETVKCRPPLDETLFYAPVQGSISVEGLGFDLDSPDARARYVKPQPDDVGPPRFSGDYFADNEHTLKNGDQVTFLFTARTFEQDCSFRYRFDLVVDGEPTSQVVDDGGEPFRVSGLIRQENDQRAPVDCTAYGDYFVANHLAQGNLRELAKTPWVPGRQASACS